ncbi:poly(hydroxyalkanoate) granule-associated protein [Pseudomonas sp. BIGb0408]|uniref:Poly(Hydroxyalkanoate) granule-associated protein n=1 Tax=Phytopseudomonas flavescens TaxID=29435 RepID=A0A7Y9XRB2_9GAMM|nr:MULTISPECIES: phasin family protein [Pseudomonas]MCW2294666.1 poly(hydroxyalkanoate) granule-associated protein [Pseudomonas sp. BIGb0408]NYH76060.1 poly(hydroxyalkanoate) granule-associated protein [Pseudomonas flavescens]
MAVKKKSEKQTGSWVGEVEKYSRQIWLAGLGAYSKVSKDGTKLFDTLVKDGERAEKAAKSDAGEQAEATKPARSRVDEVKDRAIGKWGELEEAFDKRLNSAISRLGVPSRSEVKSLSDKVELLTRQLEALTGSSTKAAAKPAAKSAAAKPSSKPAAKAPVKPAAKATTGKAVAVKKAPAGKTVAAKPAAASKSSAKPAAKPAAKAAPEPAAKPVRKPAAKKPAAAKPAPVSTPTPAASPATATTPASGNQS